MRPVVAAGPSLTVGLLLRSGACFGGFGLRARPSMRHRLGTPANRVCLGSGRMFVWPRTFRRCIRAA
jgi:hypothetical protein